MNRIASVSVSDTYVWLVVLAQWNPEAANLEHDRNHDHEINPESQTTTWASSDPNNYPMKHWTDLKNTDVQMKNASK